MLPLPSGEGRGEGLATRIDGACFAALMAPLGPFDERRRVVAAVSGGADSMALALLLRGWGDPLAVVVDHGLRPDSASEAALTLARLAALGIPARAVRLTLAPGPGLGARARAARYDALLGVCRAEGRPDLVLGHHARDQAETLVLRARRGSGPMGLAGMAAIAWRGRARLLRPLLPVQPGRLRATLVHAGVHWAEDPGNSDPATPRGALRRTFYTVPDAQGRQRAAAEVALAAELAACVTLFPSGHARVQGTMSAAAWAALVWTVSGREHPPNLAACGGLAQGGTLHGVQVTKGLVAREPAAMGRAVPALAGAIWDGRFVLRDAVPDATLGALGADAARMRRRPGWPAAVLRTLPALRLGGELLAVPHLAYPDAQTCRSVHVAFRPAHRLAAAPFVP